MRILRTLCSLGVAAISACGGGGGGGGANSAVRPTTAFTSWSAVAPNTNVTVEGISQSTTNEFTGGNGTDVKVTSTGTFSAVESASATLSFDNSRHLTSLSISTPSASVSFSSANLGTSIACSPGLCSAENSTGSAIVANPYDLGWNYQTFGAWSYQTGGAGMGTFTGNIGAMSIGAMTPASALPITGVGVYSGRAAGFYVNSSGDPFLTGANMTATIDFGAPTRSVQFSTSNTNLTNLNTLASTNNSALDLAGTLTYSSASNRFTGPVATGGGALNGTATGSFYGPAAEEIGGIYSLKGAGSVEAMTGGFGGKKP